MTVAASVAATLGFAVALVGFLVRVLQRESARPEAIRRQVQDRLAAEAAGGPPARFAIRRNGVPGITAALLGIAALLGLISGVVDGSAGVGGILATLFAMALCGLVIWAFGLDFGVVGTIDRQGLTVPPRWGPSVRWRRVDHVQLDAAVVTRARGARVYRASITFPAGDRPGDESPRLVYDYRYWTSAPAIALAAGAFLEAARSGVVAPLTDPTADERGRWSIPALVAAGAVVAAWAIGATVTASGRSPATVVAAQAILGLVALGTSIWALADIRRTGRAGHLLALVALWISAIQLAFAGLFLFLTVGR